MEIDRTTPDEMKTKIIKLSSLNADERDAMLAIEQAAHSWLSIKPEWHAGYVHVHMLRVPKDRQGEGYGTAIMRALCAVADARGWTLTVTPSADYGATSVPRLERFYARFGFTHNRRSKRDFATQARMIRN